MKKLTNGKIGPGYATDKVSFTVDSYQDTKARRYHRRLRPHRENSRSTPLEVTNMMSKEFLKKLGIVGITFGLSASPLVLADFHEEEDGQGSTIPQETMPGENGAADAGNGGDG